MSATGHLRTYSSFTQGPLCLTQSPHPPCSPRTSPVPGCQSWGWGPAGLAEGARGPPQERLQGLWEVYQRLGLDDDLVDPSNTLLREGPVLKISFRRSEPLERHLFLVRAMGTAFTGMAEARRCIPLLCASSAPDPSDLDRAPDSRVWTRALWVLPEPLPPPGRPRSQEEPPGLVWMNRVSWALERDLPPLICPLPTAPEEGFRVSGAGWQWPRFSAGSGIREASCTGSPFLRICSVRDGLSVGVLSPL